MRQSGQTLIHLALISMALLLLPVIEAGAEKNRILQEISSRMMELRKQLMKLEKQLPKEQSYIPVDGAPVS